MKTKMTMLLLALVSWGAYAQHEHAGQDEKKVDQKMAMFKDEKLGSAYSHYTHLKDALVASNEDEAKKTADNLKGSLASVSNGKKAADEAAKIALAGDLKEQRKAFTALSNEMASLVKGRNIIRRCDIS